jgi:hypothetical protein
LWPSASGASSAWTASIEQSPEDKLEVVRRIARDRDLRLVITVGDGINDAPALAIADLGIAMGVAGATVSSETADAVITVDRIDRVADAIHTGRRALFIGAPKRAHRHGPRPPQWRSPPSATSHRSAVRSSRKRSTSP